MLQFWGITGILAVIAFSIQIEWGAQHTYDPGEDVRIHQNAVERPMIN